MTIGRNSVVGATLAALSLWSLGGGTPASAQTDPDVRVWAGVSVQGQMGTDSPWRWASDSLVRMRDGAGTLDLLAQRVVLARDLTPRSSAGVGYAYGEAFLPVGAVREHRLVQQYLWTGGLDGHLSVRSRLEERFLGGYGFLLRGRQQVRGSWPLTPDGGLQGVASEELFVQLNSKSFAPRGVGGNRVFIGVWRTLNRRTGVEMGYVNVYFREGAPGHRRSHVVTTTLVVGL